MLLEIAGIPLRLLARDDAAASQCAARYAAFASSGVASRDVLTIDVATGGDDALAALAGLGEARVRGANGRYDIERSDYAGTVDVAARRASVTYRGALHSINSFLRVVTTLVLTHGEGFTVHASSLVRGGRAYLFAGRSGTGKTTIARLSAGCQLLSDEVSAVRRDGAGWRCYATPFWGEFEPDHEVNASAPVARVFFPVQAQHNARARVGVADAAHRLLQSAFFFGSDPALVDRLLETWADFVGATTAEQLYFRKDPSFWECIDA